MLEMIQQSAMSHDRYQVELKLDYELDRGRETHYRISTYIFVPRSLGITEKSYTKEELYRDIKNYIRIKTPEMGLHDLLEDENSPLRMVHQIVQQSSWYLQEETNNQLIHALRQLGRYCPFMGYCQREGDTPIPRSYGHCVWCGIFAKWQIHSNQRH